MSTLKMLLAEIGYRKLTFVLSLLAITMAVALLVAGPVLVDGYGRETDSELAGLEAGVEQSQQRLEQSQQEAAADLAALEDETRRTMRDLGFNLKIVHDDTDIVEFLRTGLPTVDMDEEAVHQLASDPKLDKVTHLVGTLQAETDWGSYRIHILGCLPEAHQSHARHKTPMGYTVEPGTAILGYRLAKDRKVGDEIEIGGQTLRIQQILPEQGTVADSTVVMHLHDAQKVLQKAGKINLILALECKCNEADLPAIRQQVKNTLGNVEVIRDKSRADARARQRAVVAEKHELIVARNRQDFQQREQNLEETQQRRQAIQGNMETLALVISLLLTVAAAIWVGLLALANVRERLVEIGVLRALGKSSAKIASLFLGKAVVLGLLGAAIGFLLGIGIGYMLGTDWIAYLGVKPLYSATQYFEAPLNMLLVALIGAPLLSALASYLPTVIAVSQDPATVLREP